MTDTFITLFQGNPAVIGTEEGGCDRSPHKTTADHMAWWVTQMQQHLDGGPQAGVYPMVQPQGFVVHWGRTTASEEAHLSTPATSSQLRKFGVQAGSNAHVPRATTSASSPKTALAQLMRHALLAAAQIAQAPTREINSSSRPWQTAQSATTSTAVPRRQLADEQRRMVVDHTLDEFVTAAHVVCRRLHVGAVGCLAARRSQ